LSRSGAKAKHNANPSTYAMLNSRLDQATEECVIQVDKVCSSPLLSLPSPSSPLSSRSSLSLSLLSLSSLLSLPPLALLSPLSPLALLSLLLSPLIYFFVLILFVTYYLFAKTRISRGHSQDTLSSWWEEQEPPFFAAFYFLFLSTFPASVIAR
jgi:hypothetical protein